MHYVEYANVDMLMLLCCFLMNYA